MHSDRPTAALTLAIARCYRDQSVNQSPAGTSRQHRHSGRFAYVPQA